MEDFAGTRTGSRGWQNRTRPDQHVLTPARCSVAGIEQAERPSEAGNTNRVILIEFDSFEQAVTAYESEAYQEALVVLSDGVERDFRIIEGID
ncbi:DUF1330 domain-containing protein [Kitasatospora sp. LaBMicrA B282]|uniref:DUF1330 domain-containing protein n=1 Tax=Kitasatospora sp. LaBMicrA B282 TaxID=3420949 RepID=UPI003D0FA4DF